MNLAAVFDAYATTIYQGMNFGLGPLALIAMLARPDLVRVAAVTALLWYGVQVLASDFPQYNDMVHPVWLMAIDGTAALICLIPPRTWRTVAAAVLFALMMLHHFSSLFMPISDYAAIIKWLNGMTLQYGLLLLIFGGVISDYRTIGRGLADLFVFPSGRKITEIEK